MRLYSLTNAAAVDDPEFGHIEADPDHGGFDLPDELSDRLHRFHYRGRPAWETDEERARRMHGEEMARRRDPESLYSAVSGIADLTRQLAAVQLGQAPAAAEVPPGSAARIADLERQLAELQADQAHPTPADGDSGPRGDAEDAEPAKAPQVKPAQKARPSAAKAPRADAQPVP